MPISKLNTLAKSYEILVQKKKLSDKISKILQIFSKKSKEKTINEELKELINRVLMPFTEVFEEEAALFNDKIICAFFSALAEKHKRKKNIAYIPPCDFKHTTYRINQLQSNTSSMGYQLRNAQLIFWPISDKDSGHWYLLAIKVNNNQTFEIMVLDGLNIASSAYLEQGVKLLRTLFPLVRDKQISSRKVPMPKQDNLRDCGPFICLVADLMCKGECFSDLPKKLKSRDYSFARLFPVSDLLAQQNATMLYNYTTKQKMKKMQTLRAKLKTQFGASKEDVINLTSEDQIDLTKEEDTSTRFSLIYS